jgi:hypothetical protein
MLRFERLSDESCWIALLLRVREYLPFQFAFFSNDYFSTEKDHVTSGSAATSDESKEDRVKIAGGSVIVDPMGKILAGPLRGKEG